jgi:hypothetical protein
MKRLTSVGAWLAALCAGLALLAAPPALADNQTSKNASGATFTFCTKTASGVEHPCHVMEGYDGSAYRVMSTDSSGRPNVNVVNVPNVVALTSASVCSVQVQRPANTTAYAAGDAWADSASAPTAGGFTCANASTAASNSGIITGAMIMGNVDAATDLQGEIVVYDQAVTAINDNAAFAPSDSDAPNQVCRIPFVLANGDTNNSNAQIDGLSCQYTTQGTANLRFLVKVLNAYTPTSQEWLYVRLKFIRLN